MALHKSAKFVKIN